MKIELTESGSLAEMLQDVRDCKKISAFGMPLYNRLLASSLIESYVYVCTDFIAARGAYNELKCVREDVVLLPPKDDVLAYRLGQSGENSTVRLRAMCGFATGKARVIVTSVDAMAQLYPNREKFVAKIVAIQKGEQYDIDDLSGLLSFGGYRREAQVSASGQFSVRGDILDVWEIGENNGYRVEFFDNEVEKIKLFDIGEQVSLGEIEKIEICPNTDIFITEKEAEQTALFLAKESKKMRNNSRTEDIVSSISLSLLGGERSQNLNFIMPLVGAVSFFKFFTPSCVVYDDAKAVYDSAMVTYSEHSARYKSLLERGEVLPFSYEQLVPQETLFGEAKSSLAFHNVMTANRIFQPNAVVNFSAMPLGDYSKDYVTLLDDIAMWSQKNKVIICAGSDGVKNSLAQLLQEHYIGFSYDGGGAVTLTSDLLEHGAIFFEQNTVYIGTYDITRRNPKKMLKRSKKDVFVEPSVGDYVVHNVHGIGICESISLLDLAGSSRDYIVIKYAGSDRLYVPIENMDSLSKLVAGEEHPRLSKIGGADFAAIKEKVRASVKGMAIDLVKLYAERANAKGYVYSQDMSLLDEFSADFPYTETDDQITAINEGLNDLTSGKIMDRLLCGDVGYGKTEVALRLAFKVISEGKQVAFISPTTILARQHYNTCVARFERFGLKCASLTRFDSAADINKALENIAIGKVDLICGTHRTLSKDVVFADLGMLILDEEQRFGVADKEKIKKIKNNVNVLSLSATPIPRTLHMSMVGIRDISVLDTPPADRIPIQTYVSEYTESLAQDAINREVNRGGQVFIVFNRVAEIDKFAASISRLEPALRVSVAHGQMAEGALEKVIAAFVAGESDILVASTIIENGIDMPRANTMIVIDADNLGLSQLYQLRGRVGRSNRLAYVYFTFEGKKILTDTAYKRLDAITQFTEFGSGFKIAMRDLEIRGAGNILGREQHGHIEKVGYDMYCKLLAEAVDEVNGVGAPSKDKNELKVNTDFNAFVPETYVADSEWRVRLYTKIARLETKSEHDKLLADITDIYGAPPDSARNLLALGLIKNIATKMGASGVTLKRTGCFIMFDKLSELPEKVNKLIERSKAVKFNLTQGKISFGAGVNAKSDLIKFLFEFQKS